MKHESKTCPRCRREFECKTGTITQCQCSAVSLSEPELEFIAHHYHDCLCASCLAILQQEARKQLREPPPPVVSRIKHYGR